MVSPPRHEDTKEEEFSCWAWASAMAAAGSISAGKKFVGSKGMLASMAMATDSRAVARAVPSGLRRGGVEFMCVGRGRESGGLNRRDAEDAEGEEREEELLEEPSEVVTTNSELMSSGKESLA